MLKSEIEPYAQAHIEALDKIRAEILDVLPFVTEPSIQDKMNDWHKQLQNTERAFTRFQVCMIDEHHMKEVAQKRAEHCRLHHKDL